MFQQSKKQASQLMRSALPMMAKLDIPPTPYNYGIWYEYVSNRTPKLNEIVDKTLRRFGNLPAYLSQELFSEYLLSEEFQYTYRQAPTLRDLTNGLTAETTTISGELSQFQKNISSAKTAINKTKDPQKIEQLTVVLEQSASKANAAVEHYNSTLVSAQEELATLRAELEDVRKNTELDPMTFLSNEKGFERTLLSLTPYAEDDLSLLLIDIDNLGSINDEYGKKVGTSLIRYIAKLLQKILPQSAFVSRISGGRFAVLLSETEISVAYQLAENIKSQVEIEKIRYKNTKELLRPVTVSIGVATLFGDESPDELIEKAQHYLVYAKRSGKNCVIHHE